MLRSMNDAWNEEENGQALARNTDPDTSHAAAASIDALRLCLKVYEVMVRYGPDGCIADDVGNSLPQIKSNSLTPRYRQMIDAGMIEVTGERRQGNSRRYQQVRRILPPPFIPIANKLSSRAELVNALEQMINVFYDHRKRGLQEMQTIEQAIKVFRRSQGSNAR